MIQITPQMRILVAVESVDFRKGIDSLAELCRQKLDADPFSGYLFVFRSRRATSIKVLVYDGQGFWLATKRLSKGRFRWWPQGEGPARVLRVHQAQVLLAAGNPDIDAAPVWRNVSRSLFTCVPKLVLAHCCYGGLSGPELYQRRDRIHPAAHRRSSGAEPLETVAATV